MYQVARSRRSEHYPRFSREEHARRLEAVADMLDEDGLAGLVLYGSRATGGWPIYYLSNWIPTRETYLVVPRQGPPTLVVQLQNHVQNAADMAVIDDVRYGGRDPQGRPDSLPTLAAILSEAGLAHEEIGFVGTPSATLEQRLRDLLPGCRWRSVGSKMDALTAVKSEEEVERLRRAAAVTDAGLEELRDGIRPGMTERDLAGLVEQGCRRAGGGFGIRHLMSTSMADPDCAVPAQYASERPVGVGDVVVVELSGKWGNYSAQALRTFVVGAAFHPQFRALHDVAVQAFTNVAAVLKDGCTVAEVHAAAAVIEDAGFTIIDDLLHGANQSRPIVRTRHSSDGVDAGFRFRAGMAVVVQPNVASPDLRAGVQFGEMLVIRDDGIDRLHRIDRCAFEHLGSAAL